MLAVGQILSKIQIIITVIIVQKYLNFLFCAQVLLSFGFCLRVKFYIRFLFLHTICVVVVFSHRANIYFDISIFV